MNDPMSVSKWIPKIYVDVIDFLQVYSRQLLKNPECGKRAGFIGHGSEAHSWT